MCSRSWELQLNVNKHEAKCTLLIYGTCCCFVFYFNWKFELCSSAEAGIVLNLFLNFEQKWTLCSYKIFLIKTISVYDILYVLCLIFHSRRDSHCCSFQSSIHIVDFCTIVFNQVYSGLFVVNFTHSRGKHQSNKINVFCRKGKVTSNKIFLKKHLSWAKSD